MHRDDQSRTLLHHAVSTGSKEVVRYLLDHGKLDLRPLGSAQAGEEAARPLTLPSPPLSSSPPRDP